MAGDWLTDLRDKVGNVAEDVVEAAKMYDAITKPPPVQTTVAQPVVTTPTTATVPTPSTLAAKADGDSLIVLAVGAVVVMLLLTRWK